jgi:tape measure domain-containing protein
VGVLTAVYAAVLPDTRGFGPQVHRELSRVDVSSAGRRVGGTFTSGLKSGLVGVGKVATAAFATIAAGAGTAGAFGLKIASQNEQAQISFETMLGSAAKAQKFLGQLQAFAAKTPFEFPELQTAASSLISTGIEARKVIPIMTTLGNVTSGMGTGSEGVKRATIALQQMNAAGRITAEDLNQLRDAGIPVFDLLAAATGKSKKEVAGLAQAGKLGSKELGQLMKALESGKGLERFNGLMQKQSASLLGMWSTLKDTFGQGLARAIEPALPAIKDLMDRASKQMQAFFAGLQGQGALKGFKGTFNEIGLGIRAMIAAFKDPDVTSDGIVGTFERIGSKARQVFDYVRGTVIPTIREWWASFRSGGSDTEQARTALVSIGESVRKLGPALQGLNTSLPSFTDALTVGSKVLGFFADNVDTLVKFMPLLVGALIAYKIAQLAANVAQAVAVPTKIAEVIVNRQLVKSNRELIASRITLTGATVVGTASEAANTAAKTAGTQATMRQRIAIVASTIATKAIAAATVVWTVVQRVLNAVLRANPIGLVITAIGLLVAGIIYAYKNSETFRKIVDGAFRAVAQAGKFMWENVLKPTFRFLVNAWLTVASAIVNGAATAFGWVPGLGGKLKEAARKFNQFKDDVNAALNGVKSRNITVSATLTAGPIGRTRYAAAKGWRIPGYGGGDTVPIMAERGEAIIPKHLVPEIAGWASRNRIPGFRDGGIAGGLTVTPELRGREAFGDSLDRFNRSLDQMARKMVAQLGGGSVAGNVGAMMGVLRQAFPGLQLISGYRPGAITATGNRSYHASGRAVDIPPRMDVFNWIRANYGARTRELIFSPANGAQVWNGRPHMYSGVTRRDHWDHVHWAMDRGGYLEPGWNPPIWNGTGRREPVTPASTMDAVIAELRALRRELAQQPVVVQMDSRPVARAVRNQNTRNQGGW